MFSLDLPSWAPSYYFRRVNLSLILTFEIFGFLTLFHATSSSWPLSFSLQPTYKLLFHVIFYKPKSMTSTKEESGPSMAEKKHKRVHRRKWEKWVSEISVPGSQEQPWLGSYATTSLSIVYVVRCLCPALTSPNSSCVNNVNILSPKSAQEATFVAGMGMDEQMIGSTSGKDEREVDESSVI